MIEVGCKEFGVFVGKLWINVMSLRIYNLSKASSVIWQVLVGRVEVQRATCQPRSCHSKHGVEKWGMSWERDGPCAAGYLLHTCMEQRPLYPRRLITTVYSDAIPPEAASYTNDFQYARCNELVLIGEWLWRSASWVPLRDMLTFPRRRYHSQRAEWVLLLDSCNVDWSTLVSSTRC